MLIRWSQQLLPDRESRLRFIDPRVQYWAAAWSQAGYNGCIPIEWWISFSSSSKGLVWVMEWSESVVVVYWTSAENSNKSKDK